MRGERRKATEGIITIIHHNLIDSILYLLPSLYAKKEQMYAVLTAQFIFHAYMQYLHYMHFMHFVQVGV